MIFIWDNSKNQANKKKHGVSFEEAETVFYDTSARLIADPDHSDYEDRFIILGMSSETKLLVVVHVYKENDEIIRLYPHEKLLNTNKQNIRGDL